MLFSPTLPAIGFYITNLSKPERTGGQKGRGAKWAGGPNGPGAKRAEGQKGWGLKRGKFRVKDGRTRTTRTRRRVKVAPRVAPHSGRQPKISL